MGGKEKPGVLEVGLCSRTRVKVADVGKRRGFPVSLAVESEVPGLESITCPSFPRIRGLAMGITMDVHPLGKSWFCVFSAFLQCTYFTCEIRKGSTSYCYSVMSKDNCGIHNCKMSLRHFSSKNSSRCRNESPSHPCLNASPMC